MLKLSNISKKYIGKAYEVDALRDINIEFRKNEFVCILGPSGCGKTTMLNIIGGLDRYTSGDLIIDGKSTKDFKDRDWDNYRNKKIGFVFQSYNLIPHLSILGNVELALTISGVGKKERQQKAIEALKRVGLESVIKKKPNQLSGGQMQRVAIARALVNDPEILLADEPTGALDIKTSYEVMELIKSISKERLVIMVTHNGEIAEKYSTRIIKLLDGQIVDDSKPYKSRNKKKEDSIINNKKTKKSSMNFLTALSLSLKNLFSKKGRTILTSFAGSIGIVGIALVLAISNGFTNYINKIQSDALGAYPLTVSAISVDMNSFTSFGEKDDVGEVDETSVSPYNPAFQFIKYGHFNNLSKEFIEHVKKFEQDDLAKGENKQINLIEYNYFTPLKVLSKNEDDSINLFKNSNTTSVLSGTQSDIFYPILNNIDFVMSQYDLIYGSMPEKKEGDPFTKELLLVVGEGNKISYSLLNKLGFSTPMVNGEYEKISFEEICNKEFKLLFNDDYYFPNSENFDEITAFSKLEEGGQEALKNAYNGATVTLKISGILRLKESAPASLLSSGVAYMPDLGNYYRENCQQSLIARKQLSLPKTSNFFDNYVVNVQEISVLPRDGFASVQEINNFLKLSYGYELEVEEAFDLAMQQIGISETPTGIYFYPKNFDSKDSVIEMINQYNSTQTNENKKIVYVDSSGFLTETLGSIINIISYVLIAFAAISLVFSSIMIGIITYVSVIERTMEIGVLRSLGARKRDVANVFNSETFIIGFLAGIIGGVATLLLTIPINLIVGSLVPEIGSIAVVNPIHILILTAISVLLSIISGLIPARIASKKDPVIALRSE